ncbi:IucA/IucC family protein, partial [Yersinia similis]
HSQPLDALQLIIELNNRLGISEKMLPVYLDEISSTLYGYAFKYHQNNLSATQLVHANYQTVETAMSEGHPVFIANNGRIGFDITDYAAYAPESA